MMNKLYDLQLFAGEANTQTTGHGGLSAEMKTYYGMELLETPSPSWYTTSSPPPSLCLPAAAKPWSGASSAPLTRR